MKAQFREPFKQSTGTTATTCAFPSGLVRGAAYYAIGVADSANTVVESNEGNNWKSSTTTVIVP